MYWVGAEEIWIVYLVGEGVILAGLIQGNQMEVAGEASVLSIRQKTGQVVAAAVVVGQWGIRAAGAVGQLKKMLPCPAGHLPVLAYYSVKEGRILLLLWVAFWDLDQMWGCFWHQSTLDLG